MDYLTALKELTAEKAKLDSAIRTLEKIVDSKDLSERKRGRKPGAFEQRSRTHEKVRLFWESRQIGS